MMLVALAADVVRASAVVLPPVTVDGPSQQIVGFGGVAMADDGTGGLVYLKQVGGVAHVFVARFAGGRWQPPIRVDTAETYAASWPRIGAADGGELVVVWATPFATQNNQPVQELLGATLGEGSSSFGPAIIIDPGVGVGTGLSPMLAMSSTGQADVVYRHVGFGGTQALLRPGDVAEQVVVSHFNGEFWTRLGVVDRDMAVSMRPPTQSNAPQIAIGPTGNGLVVWQEPEINGVARIWARRIFGRRLGYVLPVSAASFNGAAIDDDADAPSLALGRLGEPVVAYRQTVGPGSPLPGPRVFVNKLLGEGAAGQSGAQFLGAGIADPAIAGGTGATVGAPSVDLDEHREDVRLLYDGDGAARLVQQSAEGPFSTLVLNPPFTGNGLSAVSVINPAGGGIAAWPSADASGDPAVAVREDFPDGAVQTALASGGAGGAIEGIAVGRSDLGDGLVAFQQGATGDAGIVAEQVTAPPPKVIFETPIRWVKPAKAVVSWQPPTSANGPLSYQVVLDGRPLATRGGTFTLHLDPRGLADGAHRVQILDRDSEGQSTLSAPAIVHVDGEPPTVTIQRTRTHAGILLRVSDHASGVDARAVRVRFGDGARAGGRALFRHRYPHPGIYWLAISVRDRVGNAAVIHRPVSVR